jgi:hypothetical protein
MIKILIHRKSSSLYKRFLFPKDQSVDCLQALEVTVDYAKNEFVAKKVKLANYKESEDWVLYDDSTFPSSLWREFLWNDLG